MSEWIEWNGGECPVGLTTPVIVRFKDGYEETEEFEGDSPAGYWNWAHEGHDGDIIAYRVVEQ